jgi:hypothetical protein
MISRQQIGSLPKFYGTKKAFRMRMVKKMIYKTLIQKGLDYEKE